MDKIEKQFKLLEQEIHKWPYIAASSLHGVVAKLREVIDEELECPNIGQDEAEQFYGDNPELLGEISVPTDVLVRLYRKGIISTAEMSNFTLDSLFEKVLS